MERAVDLIVASIVLCVAIGFVVYGVLAAFDVVSPFGMKTLTVAACWTFANLFVGGRSANK